MISDEHLMNNVYSENLSSLGLLFERYHKELYNFFIKTTGNRDASADMTQNVFYRIIKYRKSYKKGHKFRTWMYQIARNVSVDEYKVNQEGKLAADIVDYQHLIKDESADENKYSESLEILQHAMSQLPIEKRELITYGILMEMTSEEVAEIYEISPNNARVRLHRAVRELKSIYHKAY